MNSVQEYADACTDELYSIVDKVRGKLPRLDRATLSSLIVVDVHARETVQNLATQGVSNKSDFAWMSQLRYTWENDEVCRCALLPSPTVQIISESCMATRATGV